MNQQSVLLLQSRPENDVSDNEFEAICRVGGVAPERVVRLRMDRDELGEIDLDDYAAVIMGGGPANFAYPDEKKLPEQKRYEVWLINLMREIIKEDKPFLGLCLGVGAVAMAQGMKPSFDYGEITDMVEVVVNDAGKHDPLLDGLGETFTALSGHKEGIGEVPAGCVELARSDKCVHMIRAGQNVYATQFHPELDLPGFALRVEAYRDHGYFAPEEGDEILAQAAQWDFTKSAKVLQNFVKRYVQ